MPLGWNQQRFASGSHFRMVGNPSLGFTSGLPVLRPIARRRWRTSRSRLDSSGYRVKSGLAGASCIDALYAFLKRTRTSQKISMISGSMVRIKYNVVLNRAGGRCCSNPTAESNLSGRFEGPTMAYKHQYFLGHSSVEQRRLQQQAGELAAESAWLFDQIGLAQGSG